MAKIQIKITITINNTEKLLLEELQRKRILSLIIQKVLEKGYHEEVKASTLQELLPVHSNSDKQKFTLSLTISPEQYLRAALFLTKSDKLIRSIIIGAVVKRLTEKTVEGLLTSGENLQEEAELESTVKREMSKPEAKKEKQESFTPGIGVHYISDLFKQGPKYQEAFTLDFRSTKTKSQRYKSGFG